MKNYFQETKTVNILTKIVSVLQKLFHHNENKKKIFSGWPKSVFGEKIVFLYENIENIGKVLSGNKNYFRSLKIIFGEKPIFGLTTLVYCALVGSQSSYFIFEEITPTKAITTLLLLSLLPILLIL
jgi:hypothetical protein